MGLFRRRDQDCGGMCPCAAWPEEPDERPGLADLSLPAEGVE